MRPFSARVASILGGKLTKTHRDIREASPARRLGARLLPDGQRRRVPWAATAGMAFAAAAGESRDERSVWIEVSERSRVSRESSGWLHSFRRPRVSWKVHPLYSTAGCAPDLSVCYI